MNQELLPPAPQITEYKEFHSQLAALADGNAKAVFDYRDPKGNKEARSHIHKLRRTKGAIERKRKELKESVLERGRLIDSEAKSITAAVESMIEIHETPILQIEQEEAARVKKHRDAIAEIEANMDPSHQSMSSGLINSYLHDLEALEPDESFEEFTAEAISAYKKAHAYLLDCHNKATQREAEQAELERLRKEAAERERAEREARIAAEAKAKAEAEAKAAAERREREIAEQQEAAKREAERKEREAAEALARAEREKQEAIARAEADKKAAEERQRLTEENANRQAEEAARRERARIEREQAAAKAEQERIAANKAHRRKINHEVLNGLVMFGLDEGTAKALIEAIAKSEIANVTINY